MGDKNEDSHHLDKPEHDEEQPNEETGSESESSASESHVAHYKNEAHPVALRFGLPLFLLGTLILLINSDIGSGVSAEYILLRNGNIEEQRALLEASIFSSVKELWHNQSYPLAIFIAITSIGWPYIKLGLTFYAWLTPYDNVRKRELLIEVIDALGKWSFVDIIVLVEIMVAFRSSMTLGSTGSVGLEIVVEAKWGFFGFVLATMMSLVATHVTLHFHRKLHYHDSNEREGGQAAVDDKPIDLKTRGAWTSNVIYMAAAGVVLSIGCYLAGVLVDVYEVTNTRGSVSFTNDYSIVSVGEALPDSQLDPSEIGTRFIQAMWFFLCVAMPLWCSVLFGALFMIPMSKLWTERVFFLAEVAFAWSCAEVLLVSTIFSVLQMPTFGDGLIEADCDACFIVDTKLLPMFTLLCIGTILNVGVNVWLYRKAHSVLYGS